MSYPRLSLTLNDASEEYYLIEITADLDALEVPCHKCGGKCGHRASVIFFGFWEDRHLIFVECQSCHYLQVIKQDMPFYWEVDNGSQNQ